MRAGAPLGAGSGRHAWVLLGLLLLLPALAGHGTPLAGATLAWEPGLAWREPWRWWSAAWLHFSTLHLVANLAGGTLVIALGWSAAVERRDVLAWSLAWPLGHLALLMQPALLRYGGLSGVLHAGVAVVAVRLLRRGGQARPLGAAIAAVLLLKLLLEAPWRGPLSHPAGWDIAVAPLAHSTGAACGALLALALSWKRRDGGA